MASLYAKVEHFVNESGKGRSSAEGNLYHVHLTIMTMLRQYQFHQKFPEFDFMVAIEVAAAGKFDDILYLYSSPGQGNGVLFIQAKHKENAGSQLQKDTLFPLQEDSTGSYSIPMYFMSFLEVDQKLPRHEQHFTSSIMMQSRKIVRTF
uniref:Uncharacterized protein n=1 Tax=Anopheles culicifacies TaxID=139723 RepID=A0A182MB60_9DIPT